MALPHALKFAVDVDGVNCGSAAALDNVATGTMMAWLNPSNVAASTLHRILNKLQTQRTSFLVGNTNAGDLRFSYNRSTTNCEARSNGGVVITGLPQIVSAVWNAAGVNGDQKLYVGSIVAPLAEVSAYAVQTVGSGTHQDASGDVQLGKDGAVNTHWTGVMWWVGFWNRVLTLSDQQAIADGIRAKGDHPLAKVAVGCLGSWLLGRDGSLIVRDRSGSNNHGAITGCAPTSDLLPGPSRSMRT